MADRQAALAAYDQGCACRNRSRLLRWHQSACGPTHRQSPRPSTGRQWPRTHDLALLDQRRIDSIPIVRHRLRGRFSPMGSFAYRTRGDATPMASACAPRPPGKRLSALCRALHSDPLLSFADVQPRAARHWKRPFAESRPRAVGTWHTLPSQAAPPLRGVDCQLGQRVERSKPSHRASAASAPQIMAGSTPGPMIAAPAKTSPGTGLRRASGLRPLSGACAL